MNSNTTNPFSFLVDHDTADFWFTSRPELEEELLNPFPIDFNNLPQSPDFSEEAPMMFSFAQKEKVDEDTVGKTSSTVKPKCETQKDGKTKQEDKPNASEQVQNLLTTMQMSEVEETPKSAPQKRTRKGRAVANPVRRSFRKHSKKTFEECEKESDESFEPAQQKSQKKVVSQAEAFTRWDRQDDKVLFEKIREFEKQGILTLDEILRMDEQIEGLNNKAIKLLAREVGWKAMRPSMIIRVKSLCSRDFSVRELKQLKRIVKQEFRYKNLDYDKVLYEFPGKTMARTKEVCDEICNRRTDRTLSTFHLCLEDYKKSGK